MFLRAHPKNKNKMTKFISLSLCTLLTIVPLFPLNSASVLVYLVVGDLVERVAGVGRAVYSCVVLVAALDYTFGRCAHQDLEKMEKMCNFYTFFCFKDKSQKKSL